ncbi:MAG: Cyclic pyranopterin phosphate synthase (MoaA) [uncultured Truepera sp.]|uniref:GTP 3',8-cyclase n=1 Tax=uncultured Truepera sp. TaxID=543023 RepID=A0A6J4V725_9DEIN|nr:MAG: Cyclic pyranopterin phosphate synthase (MoaA) [uncultured Truepera sp.]
MKTLVDQHGRVVRDLRISVTPRCNFRCTYCDPLGMGHRDPFGTVSVRDVAYVVDAAVGLGITSVRFTGGEPLLRKELPEMIALAKTAKVEDIAITTNATLLKRRLPELLDAGLHRVNISLDAVDEGVFKQATGGGSSKPVWEGIDELLTRGLHPVKLNAVVMRGVNDSEITKLAALTQTLPLHVRFIEYMHLNNADSEQYQKSFVPGWEIRALVEQEFGALEAVPTDPSAPARLFKVPGWIGAVGFINPVSEPFCGLCSRMRLTSDAKLRPCLLNDREFDLRPALENAEPVTAIQEMFLVAAHRKVASGITTPTQRARTMVAIGG